MAIARDTRSGARRAEPAGTRRAALRRFVAIACRLGIWAAAAVTLLGLAAGNGFVAADLANNLMVQVALVTLCLLAAATALRLRRAAVIAFLALVVQGATLAPAVDWPIVAAIAGDGGSNGTPTATGTATGAGGDSDTVRLIAFNVLGRNGRHRQTVDYLRREAADIVVLSEIAPAWGRSLEVLEDLYPYCVGCDDELWCGLVILSRHPLREGRAGILDQGPTPVVDVQVRIGEAELRVVGTHLMRGLSRRGLEVKQAQAAFLPSLLAGDGGPTILVGDLNSATWSLLVRELERGAGLNAAGGLTGTWPAFAPVPLRVPIDHVLAGRGVEVLERRLGPALGSDHLPVVITLGLVQH